MKNHVLFASALLAGVSAIALPSAASAQAWTKSFVISYVESAFHYGAKDGLLEPGSDCPDGTMGEPDWTEVMVKAGYPRDQADWMRDPANPMNVIGQGHNQFAFRGKDRANVYIHPTSTPESGHLKEVVGKLGEGIDLDGNPATGFTGINGAKGVDNNFYKSLGCWKLYRGPRHEAVGALTSNGYMHDGLYTIAIVVSGSGADPMNDPNVQVGFYDSSDKLVKNATGGINAGYTFSVRPSQKFEGLFKAKTVGGRIVTTQATDEMWMREPSYLREVQLLKAQLELKMEPDGRLTGYLAGYRPWQPVYQSFVDARGVVIERLYWIQLPDVYYALRRNADYSPTGPKGEKTHISTAFRIEAIPAYVMTPEGQQQLASIVSYKSLATGVEPPTRQYNFSNLVDGLILPKGVKVAAPFTDAQLQPPVQTASVK